MVSGRAKISIKAIGPENPIASPPYRMNEISHHVEKCWRNGRLCAGVLRASHCYVVHEQSQSPHAQKGPRWASCSAVTAMTFAIVSEQGDHIFILC